MAVAVKNTPENQTQAGTYSLPTASLLGSIYILGSLALVLWGVPYLWKVGVANHLPEHLSFVSTAGLILVMLVSAGLLIALGSALLGPNPPHGIRAGVGVGMITVILALILGDWLSGLIASASQGLSFGLLLGFLIVVALLGAVIYTCYFLLSRPSTLAALEDQGWFQATRYKPMLGQLVRRSTMLGLIAIVGFGIYTLYSHGTLNAMANDWMVRIPFTSLSIPLIPDVKLTLPIILGAIGFWLAYRVVNLPVFADFLIATEAELNKVSWPSRRSVIQDTIVVLVTVFLLTIFLFLVDLAWGWILSRNMIGVLRVSPTTTIEKTQKDRIDW